MLQDVFELEEFAAAPVLTPQQESHYLQAYLPLVRKVVRQLAPQCNGIIDRQDMEQTALMGLLNAIRRYGLPDEGFAGYAVHRIRGAILDELRALDWRPRQLRQKYHQMKDLIRETRKKLGHEPEWSELAGEGISHEDYLEYQQLEGAETLASLDELLNGEGSGIPLAGRELEEQFVNDSNYKFLIDTREYLMKKIGKLEFPDAILKRIMLLNNQEKGEAFVAENYDRSIEELTWHLIKEKLVAANEIKVDNNDIMDMAKEVTRIQFAQYGMLNVPDDMLDNYAKEMLKRKDSVEQLVNRSVESKLAKALKDKVKLNNKTVSVEDFNKMFE